MKALIFTLVITFACFQRAISGDPDIVSDVLAPPHSTLNSSFFTFSGLRSTFGNFKPPKNVTVNKVSMAELPVLNGQSVSCALLQYPAGSVNPPHTHPRAGELLFLVYGVLKVGFVNTTNKLYTQTLQAGDIFVFPKGLLHYEFNFNKKDHAIALSAYGGASPGTVSVPVSVFATGIDEHILAKAFKTDIATIRRFEAGLKPPKA